MSKSVPQLTEKTDSEDADLFHIVRSSVDYKTTKATLFDDLRFSNFANDYDAGTSYEVANPPSKRYAMYNNILWKFIGASPATGVTPGTDATKWEKTYCAELAHFVGEDSVLASGTADEVTAADLRIFLDDRAEEAIIKYVSVPISAAQIKTLNSSSVVLVDAPGDGKAIEVIAVSCKFNWVAGVAFDNGQLLVQPQGATFTPFLTGTTFLNGTANSFLKLFENAAVSTGNSLVENASLRAATVAASTTTGISNIVIYVAYRIITL